MWMCRCVDMWICGCVDVWICGCVDVWICGCVDMWMWMCGCVDVWMCGCVDGYSVSGSSLLFVCLRKYVYHQLVGATRNVLAHKCVFMFL